MEKSCHEFIQECLILATTYELCDEVEKQAFTLKWIEKIEMELDFFQREL